MKITIIKSLSTLISVFILLLVNGQTPSIQHSAPLTAAAPETVGMSSVRLNRIDSLCIQAIEENQVPGIVALVARKGKIVYQKAFGTADAPAERALMEDDIFRIASQSKAITSTAVLMLWEKGLFQLDDPISKYIPEFKNPQVLKSFRYSYTSYTTEPANQEITIRHLLTHSSGLGYGIIDGDERFKMIYQKAGITDLFTTENISIAESIKKLAKLPLHNHPGEVWTYSEGLDVLGYFIEIISGMSFAEYLETNLFEPLGMNDTYFYLPEEKASRLVKVQQWEDGKWQLYPTTFYDPDYPIKGAKRFYSGGAGLSSTVKDYATFLQMYLNKGELNGVRILSRTTVEMIMHNQIGNLWENGASYYGLAFEVQDIGGEAGGGKGSQGSFSWGGYFNTQYFADPEEEYIGILFKQTQGPVNDQTSWKFRILVGQAVDD